MTQSQLDQSKFPFLLRAIYVRDSRMLMTEDFDPLRPGQELRGLIKTEARPTLVTEVLGTSGGGQRSYTFVNRFGFRYDRSSHESEPTDGSGEGQMLAEITADIAVNYVAQGLDVPTEETITQWSQTSALVHAWPYWREFSHTAMVRMNLPLSIMPLMDIRGLMGSGQQRAEAGELASPPPSSVHKRRARSATK